MAQHLFPGRHPARCPDRHSLVPGDRGARLAGGAHFSRPVAGRGHLGDRRLPSPVRTPHLSGRLAGAPAVPGLRRRCDRELGAQLAADHRVHHCEVDQERDPYNITKGFWWAHIGWIFFSNEAPPQTVVRDLLEDPLVRWQARWYAWIGTAVAFGAFP